MFVVHENSLQMTDSVKFSIFDSATPHLHGIFLPITVRPSFHDDEIKWKHISVTGPLEVSVAELYPWSAPEQTVEQTIETPVISDAIALIIRRHCNVEHWIEPVNMELLYVKFIFSTRIFYRRIPWWIRYCDFDFDVCCRGLNTCLLYVISPFGNLVLNDSLSKSLT